MFFFLLYNAHCLLAHQVSLRHLAMRGEQKKIREIKLGKYRRCKFGPYYLLAQRKYIYPYFFSIILFSLHGDKNSPRFAYSSGHYLLILLYWGGNRNT